MESNINNEQETVPPIEDGADIEDTAAQSPQSETAATLSGATAAPVPTAVVGKKEKKQKLRKDKKIEKLKAKSDDTVQHGKRFALSAKAKKNIRNFALVPIMILLSSFLRAICVRLFMTSPAFSFAQGGVTGIATMIEFKTGFSTGYSNIIINIPLLVLAFIFLSKPFAIKSAIVVALASGEMVLLEYLNFPQYGAGNLNPTNAEPVLAAVACGVMGGIATALMLRAGGSSGGTDIIAAIIQRRYEATGITWFIMGLDSMVIVCSYFVYGNGLTPVFMSLTQVFCSAFVGDSILTGIKSAIKYEIITDDPEKLSAEIIAKLKHSVTKVDAMGMYAHSNRALLICVIHKRQVSEFNNILKKYSNTFAYVTGTSEVFGKFI